MLLSMILSGFIGGAASVGGQLAAQEAWNRFFKDEPEAARLLTEGMFESIIRAVQAMLAFLGYEVDVDGEMGPQTERAVKTFQAKAGLEDIDGIPGRHTMRALTAELLKQEKTNVGS